MFHNQTKVRYENGPIIDLFVNAQWKRACIFIKIENAAMRWFDTADYFTAHHFINTQRVVKFGLFWPFYVQPGTSSGAQSTGGGSRGGSGRINTLD